MTTSSIPSNLHSIHICFSTEMTTSLRAQPNLSMAGNWGKQYLIKYLFYFITLQCSGKQQYLGPYEVFYRTEKGNYYVNELHRTKIRGTIAAFQVYPYISRC